MSFIASFLASTVDAKRLATLFKPMAHGPEGVCEKQTDFKLFAINLMQCGAAEKFLPSAVPYGQVSQKLGFPPSGESALWKPLEGALMSTNGPEDSGQTNDVPFEVAGDEQPSQSVRPLLFLDFDDVICLNTPYGGYDVAMSSREMPEDLWAKLWHEPAVNVLVQVLEAHNPYVIITSSWLRFLDRRGAEDVFKATGLERVAESLHPVWEAPQGRGCSRREAISGWLDSHHRCEAFAVLDDHLSGTGLAGSTLDHQGRVVLCEVGVGLTLSHVGKIHEALVRPVFDGR
jgi:HAD domain in Swiss Army Knife RNA repair proteins